MIGLATTTYDPNGALLINTRPKNSYSAMRRGSVTATLDGASSVYDTGYSVSDITLTATVKNPTQTLLTKIQYLVVYYGQILISCDMGCYTAVPESTLLQDTLTLKFRLVTKKSA